MQKLNSLKLLKEPECINNRNSRINLRDRIEAAVLSTITITISPTLTWPYTSR